MIHYYSTLQMSLINYVSYNNLAKIMGGVRRNVCMIVIKMKIRRETHNLPEKSLINVSHINKG